MMNVGVSTFMIIMLIYNLSFLGVLQFIKKTMLRRCDIPTEVAVTFVYLIVWAFAIGALLFKIIDHAAAG